MIVVRVAQQAAVRSQLPSLQGRGGRGQCGKHWLQKPDPSPLSGNRHRHPLHGPEIPIRLASPRHQRGLVRGLPTETAVLVVTAEHLKVLPKT